MPNINLNVHLSDSVKFVYCKNATYNKQIYKIFMGINIDDKVKLIFFILLNILNILAGKTLYSFSF